MGWTGAARRRLGSAIGARLAAVLVLGCAESPRPDSLPAPAAARPPIERLALRVVPAGFVDHSHDEEADASPAFPRDALPSDFSLEEGGYGVEHHVLRPLAAPPGRWELARIGADGVMLGEGVAVPRARVEDLYLLATDLASRTGSCGEGRRGMSMRAAGLDGHPDGCGDDPVAPTLQARFDALVAELRRADR